MEHSGEEDPPALSLREQWIGHKKAREQLLSNAIQTVDGWIAGITDADIGHIGSLFQQEVGLSGCRHEINIHHPNRAEYVSFSYRHSAGFANHIIYGPSAEEDLSKLFSSKVHEATHALQKMRSAALHASPFNPNTQIVICPGDWVILEERCEQDAYVKQALFNSLLAKHLPEVRRMTDNDPLSVKTFERIRLDAANIHDTVIEAARQALAKSFYWDNPKAEHRFQHHYHDYALKNYEAGMKLRSDNGESDLIFVRLEEEDILAIGDSCGPNSFGNGRLLPEFAAKPKLTKAAQDKLDKIRGDLKLGDEEKLPTLGDILSRLGLTRRQFIEASYTRPLLPQRNAAPLLQP
ncbi:MAG: hypothetical protein HYS17_00350 [Micavibrio aeruginosavorus]|uniref:Uncharacterized protein n=1 Tax=Micavibrio aeruginosavorus TaxID=349221 RepID=A0A7T5R2K1_9BACT|nr:MAG: hypothetical protein HYS17_00350 [Micavibrio aeruginosavorus]